MRGNICEFWHAQVVMDDADFQRNASEVALSLTAAHVRGVWEERLPLSLHSALTLGCVTALQPAAKTRPIAEGFSLSDLQVRVADESVD